jgi:hypothetical protein
MRKYEQKLNELQLKKVSGKIQQQIDDFKEAENDLANLNQRLSEEKDPEAQAKIKDDIQEFTNIMNQADDELVVSLEKYAKRLSNLNVGRPKKGTEKNAKNQPPAPPAKTPEEEEAEKKAAEKAAEQAAINERLNRLLGDMKRIASRKIYSPNPAYRYQKA